jgi:ribosome biogenesis protein SSF1/2
MQLNQAKRVLLYNYNEDTGMIDFRHYSIGVKTTGVSKSIKRVITTNLPNLGDFEDISDYVLKEAVISESDVEDGPESTVTLAQDLAGRNHNRKNEQRAIRLHELGPRMTLELVKIENGLCDGEVLYHRYIKKTPEEIKENERKRQKTLADRARRRDEQQANVERKVLEKEEHRRRTGAPQKTTTTEASDEEEDEDDEDDEDLLGQNMDMNDDDDDEDED